MSDFTTFIDSLGFPAIFWTASSIFVFLFCVLSAGVLIPQILLISFRRKLFDVPDERKIHQGVVPRLGGIAFKPVVFLSVALLIGLSLLCGYGDMLGGLVLEGRALSFGFCCIMVLYLGSGDCLPWGAKNVSNEHEKDFSKQDFRFFRRSGMRVDACPPGVCAGQKGV